MKKRIAVCYVFESESRPDTYYQALHYTDGSTSCDCKGWTRRVSADGSRCCKHTRAVDAGIARHSCKRMVEYEKAAPRREPSPAAPMVENFKRGRFVDLTPETA